MKKTGKVKHRSVGGLTLIVVLALLVGCSGKQGDVTEEPLDGIVSEDEESNISENEISGNEVSDNGVSVGGEAEDAEQMITYYMGEDEVINIAEALANFWSNEDNIQRENKIVNNYVDGLPEQLQDLLRATGDDVTDDWDEYWEEYEVECEKITEENLGDFPERILGEICASIIDIDGDGENEYFYFLANGNSYIYMGIGKRFGSGWGESYIHASEPRILYYDGIYYIYSDSTLTWFNNEVDLSEFGRSDIIGADKCWSRATLRTLTTDFTAYETYSNVQDDSINYLENIDWARLEDIGGASWKVVFGSDDSFRWVIDDTYIYLDYAWVRYYGGDRYLYVIMDDYDNNEYTINPVDRGLAILRWTEDETWEIVKAYYLSANCFSFLES